MVEALDRFYSDQNYFTVLHTILLSPEELEIAMSAKQNWQAEVEPTFRAFPSEAEQSFNILSAKLNSINDRKVKKDDYEGQDTLNDFNNQLLSLLPQHSFSQFFLHLEKLGLYMQLG